MATCSGHGQGVRCRCVSGRVGKQEHGGVFITAGLAEKNSLLGGGGGGGWAIADEGFHCWPADGPASAAAKPVCRFYSSLVNSHFYTAGAGACEMVKQPSSGWTYEGIAFRALVADQGLLLSRHHAGVAAVQRPLRPGRQQPPLRDQRRHLPPHDRQRLDRRGRGVLLAAGLTETMALDCPGHFSSAGSGSGGRWQGAAGKRFACW